MIRRSVATLLATTLLVVTAHSASAQETGAPAPQGLTMSRAMAGAFGPYSMTREASGTAWQPDTSEHDGIHVIKDRKSVV